MFRLSSRLAPEGYFFILLFLVLTILAQVFIGWYVSWIPASLFLFSLQFFREPSRSLPEGAERLVLSAADGRVISIVQTDDPYLNRKAIKVSVFMNVFNVHSNRIPVSGRVCQKWYVAGRFFNAALDKASEKNERCALWVKTHQGLDIVFVQVAGLVARRILCYVDKNDIVKVGQRYGFIRFGSRVDHYLPLECRLLVSLGDSVKSSVTPLCELPQSSSTNS